HARCCQLETGPSVPGGDERGEPAVLGERLHERLRVAVGLQRAPVLAREAVAQVAHGAADLEQLVGDPSRDRREPNRSAWVRVAAPRDAWKLDFRRPRWRRGCRHELREGREPHELAASCLALRGGPAARVTGGLCEPRYPERGFL